jgi:two-component system sensor histidine kinase KdpD
MQQACDSLGLEIEREQTLHWAQATKAESQSQRLRNTLLTAISHDYRTPLANLMGAASSIRDQCERLSTAQLRNLAQTVLDEAQHLNRMTTNTLHLARLDAAPLSIHKDWESLEEILGSVLSKTRMRYPNQRIQIDLATHLPLIHCDAILLIQLFDNLIENAIKYSPPGSLLGIQAQLHDHAIQVGVLDEGSGIDDLWKEKVFQAFERVHTQADASEVHQLRRGMGVGLAVCKAIAKVHGATIWAADRAPQGTALWLSLPLQTQPAPDVKAA